MHPEVLSESKYMAKTSPDYLGDHRGSYHLTIFGNETIRLFP